MSLVKENVLKGKALASHNRSRGDRSVDAPLHSQSRMPATNVNKTNRDTFPAETRHATTSDVGRVEGKKEAGCKGFNGSLQPAHCRSETYYKLPRQKCTSENSSEFHQLQNQTTAESLTAMFALDKTLPDPYHLATPSPDWLPLPQRIAILGAVMFRFLRIRVEDLDDHM